MYAKAATVVHPGLRDVHSHPCGGGGKLQTPCLAEARWIRGAVDGDSAVGERHGGFPWTHPSSAGHGKPRANPGGPSPKAKYSSVTDSAPVPRGKGEKHPERGVKQYLKPRAYNQWEDDGLLDPSDRVPFA